MHVTIESRSGRLSLERMYIRRYVCYICDISPLLLSLWASFQLVQHTHNALVQTWAANFMLFTGLATVMEDFMSFLLYYWAGRTSVLAIFNF